MADQRLCATCATPIIDTKGPASAKVRKYCSRRCSGLARRKTVDGAYVYRTRYVPRDHPLATPGSRVISEHRAVLWDKLGPGPHPCHHCGCLLEWMPGRQLVPGALCVDHLDRDTRNNAPDNLVPSCHPCNHHRRVSDRFIASTESYVTDKSGKRLRTVQRLCEECGSSFQVVPSRIRNGRGRYCSSRCSGTAIRRSQGASLSPRS